MVRQFVVDGEIWRAEKEAVVVRGAVRLAIARADLYLAVRGYMNPLFCAESTLLTAAYWFIPIDLPSVPASKNYDLIVAP